MTVSPMQARAAEPRTLNELASDVRVARQLVQARRMAPVVPHDLVLAHDALLRAMEAYVAELTVRRLPIPPRLRDDLRLQREFDHQRARTSRPWASAGAPAGSRS